MEKESKQRKKYILSQTMEFDDSHCSAESDAGAGGGGGRVYAWGNGSELYVGGFSGNADPVYPEYVSGGSDGEPWNSWSAVPGKR